MPLLANTKTSTSPFVVFEGDIDERLLRGWIATQRFCDMVNTVAGKGQKLPLRFLLETMASVMYRLLEMSFETTSYNEAIRLGLLAFTSNVFLHKYSTKQVERQISDNYETCVSGLKAGIGRPAGFLVWFLITGAVSEFVATEDWFESFLLASVKHSEDTSWAALRPVLKSFLWIDHLHDKPASDIYASTLSSRQRAR